MIHIELPPVDETLTPQDIPWYGEMVKVRKDAGGIYAVFDKETNLLYVGKAKNLRSRLKSHMYGVANSSVPRDRVYYINIIYVDSPMERDIYETYLIYELKPQFNKSKKWE
jgi:excinuclease UvrABC nuclease subunit